MSIRILPLGLLLLGCLIIINCAEKPADNTSQESTLIDATGVNFALSEAPSRIISLAPSLTENVYLLGCADKLVGVTTYCEFPAEAKSKEKVGNLLEPNIEKIITLKPDLVLATKEGNKPEIGRAHV